MAQVLSGYIKSCLVLAVCLYGINAHAVSEAQLENGFAVQLEKYMQSQGQQGHFITPDKVSIAYERFDQDCNEVAIIVVPGWSEPYLKYAEVIYDLRQHGYCVYTYDHRGQGLSSHPLHNSQIGHVDDFDQYVKDLQQFDDKIVRSRPHRKVFLLGHSMGGLVSVLYAAHTKQPIDGLMLIAPMLEIRTDPWPEPVAYAIVSVLDRLGLGDRYVLGHGDWQATSFAENRLTHSRSRYAFGVDLFRQDKTLIVAGVSNRWLKTSIEHTRGLDSVASMIREKILLFQAGQDQFVKNSAENHFCEKASSCQKISYENAKHELLMEKDTVRDSVFKHIYHFINGLKP
jgi:lysophospholipase